MLGMRSLLESKIEYCTCRHLLVESESSQFFHQWRLDAFSIPHYIITKERPRGARHGKTEAQKEHFVVHNARRKSISWPTTHGGYVSKRILMESTIASNEIQFIVIRNSKLAGPRKSASKWTNLYRKITPIAHHLRSSREGKNGRSHWTNQAEMHRWNSHQTSE